MRPVVVYRLPYGSYQDKDEGYVLKLSLDLIIFHISRFNTIALSEDGDSITEGDGDAKIFRRINPRLPPPSRACEHQAAEMSTRCSVGCDKEAQIDGYNITVCVFRFRLPIFFLYSGDLG